MTAAPDPVADACTVLAAYLPVLERLLAEPAADGWAMPGAAIPAETPEPWYSPAGRALMDAWEGVKRLEAWLRYLGPAGHPGRRRGGSRGNLDEALAMVPKLAAAVAEGDAERAAWYLNGLIDQARRVHGIDELPRWRRLPRRAGDRLPPRCPRCKCFQLVADVEARVVACTVWDCRDGNGVRPVALMTTGPDGTPRLEWADGLVEAAPDIDG